MAEENPAKRQRGDEETGPMGPAPGAPKAAARRGDLIVGAMGLSVPIVALADAEGQGSGRDLYDLQALAAGNLGVDIGEGLRIPTDHCERVQVDGAGPSKVVVSKEGAQRVVADVRPFAEGRSREAARAEFDVSVALLDALDGLPVGASAVPAPVAAAPAPAGPPVPYSAEGAAAVEASHAPGAGGVMVPQGSLDDTKIYVGYLPLTVDDATLRKMYEGFGTVQSAKIVKDKHTGLSKGYGFVKFDTSEQAAAAIQGTDKLQVEQKRLAVRVAGIAPEKGGATLGGNALGTAERPMRDGDWTCPACQNNNFAYRLECHQCRGPRPGAPMAAQPGFPPAAVAQARPAQADERAKLYVAYLPAEIDDAGIRKLFEPFGTVLSARVILDRQTNVSKGYGFVQMADPTAAQAAIATMHGLRFGEKTLAVRVAGALGHGGGGSSAGPGNNAAAAYQAAAYQVAAYQAAAPAYQAAAAAYPGAGGALPAYGTDAYAQAYYAAQAAQAAAAGFMPPQ